MILVSIDVKEHQDQFLPSQKVVVKKERKGARKWGRGWGGGGDEVEFMPFFLDVLSWDCSQGRCSPTSLFLSSPTGCTPTSPRALA